MLTYQEKGDTPADGPDLEVYVSDATVEIDGVTCRVVEEREYDDEVMTDLSLNYFAIDTTTNSVFYFGEDEVVLAGGKPTGEIKAGWRSGVDGASYGLIMPGTPLVGARYQQEFAPGNTLDRAEIVSVTAEVTTAAGSFKGCLQTLEGDGTDPSAAETKFYCPGVGLMGEDNVELVSFGFAK